MMAFDSRVCFRSRLRTWLRTSSNCFCVSLSRGSRSLKDLDCAPEGSRNEALVPLSCLPDDSPGLPLTPRDTNAPANAPAPMASMATVLLAFSMPAAKLELRRVFSSWIASLLDAEGAPPSGPSVSLFSRWHTQGGKHNGWRVCGQPDTGARFGKHSPATPAIARRARMRRAG
eukprot:3652175-Prymnesium_polylepis.1